ncbi:MAG TPA: aspartate-semialdehyde dehydrogenase [Gammaproteobacteria bacterium]
MSQLVDVAVAGLSSLMGETFLEVLHERQFPVNELFLIGDEEDVGKKFEFHGRYLKVTLAESFDFSRVKLLFLLDAPELAEAVGERAAAAGCSVIDLSGHFDSMPGVALVVPELNGASIAQSVGGQIIASPAGAAAPLALVLDVLQRQAGITRLNITALAPVSWVGRAGVEELAGQTASLLNARPITMERFTKQCAFNVLPQVGQLTSSGYTTEEESITRQLRRLLEIPDIPFNVTALQVPTFFGYGAVVHLELASRLSALEVEELLTAQPGIDVMCDEYPTAVTEALGQDLVYVGRIREDESYYGALALWVVFDHARKGGATNAVQIGEIMLKNHM